MPRVTRAALRTAELLEESELAASTPLPPTPVKQKRVPLGERSENVATEAQAAEIEEKMAPAKKGSVRGRKANIAKKVTKQKKAENTSAEVEILEDDNESATSSAVEEACQVLMKDSSETKNDVLDDQQPPTPPSVAVNSVTKQLSPEHTTSEVDPNIPKTEDLIISKGGIDKEDSFEAFIATRTPAKMSRVEDIGNTASDRSDEDSFVEQIQSRSPMKRVSRIEDSVEALDALEEEIEKVGKLIPTTVDNVQDQSGAKKQVEGQPKTTEERTNGLRRVKTSTAVSAKTASKKPSASFRSVAPRPSILPAVKRVSTPSSGPQEKTTGAPKSPATALDSSKEIAPTVAKNRVSSVHKAPFQPVKSTKPPTQPTFELPGEAISRKLKEQREERQKREEEEQSKQRIFKARPVRMSQAPEVKLTAAAKARLGLAKGETVNASHPTKRTTNAKAAVRPIPTTTAGLDKRLSSSSVAKRNSTIQPTANSSGPDTRKTSLSASTRTRNTSSSGAPRAAPTAEDIAHQKVKGKEVFGRTKADLMGREKARKEKEEAAKKARIEAAERGRLASREWAEKQKLRKLEAQKASAETKALAA